MLPAEGQSFILAGALISIALNPLVFKLVNPALAWINSCPGLLHFLERAHDSLTELPMSTKDEHLAGQVVLVGYGRVGKRVAYLLSEKNIPYVVVEENRELIASLRAAGFPAVYGDASEPSVLIQSHIAHASMLMIEIADTVYLSICLST